MLIDTHTHLYLPEFEDGGATAVKNAIGNGVGIMIFPNVDETTVRPLLELHSKFPDNTRVAMGLHPTEVRENWEEQIDRVPLETDGSVAVGEIGIDLYWSDEYRQQQIEAFRFQAEKAAELGLPVIIHQREALNDTLDVINSLGRKLSGVFHSFGGTIEDYLRIKESGDFYVGINGIVTFKNSKLKDVLPEIGLDRIILETDSPYLAPVPHRGKRNQSAYIRHIAAYIADIFDLELKTVEKYTTENAMNLFKLN